MSKEVIVAFITGVFGPVLLLFLKYKFSKLKKTDMVIDTLKVSETVMTKLEQVKDEFESDRVWISQFHNGGNFYPTGKSMAKFSILYEVVNPGILSIQTNFQNIPVNLFSRPINKLYESDLIEIPDFKDVTIATYGLKYVAEDSGCKSGYLFAIKTIDNKFIGILGIDFVKKKVKLNQEQITHLQVHSATLGGVMMDGLKKS
jgi:hypothetical protein